MVLLWCRQHESWDSKQAEAMEIEPDSLLEAVSDSRLLGDSGCGLVTLVWFS